MNLEVRHDLVQIQTSDSDATLYAMLDAGYRPHEIEVSSLGLEQAFIAITGEDDRASGIAATTTPATPTPTTQGRRSDMAGTLALTRAEIMRLFRNKRYFIFTVGFPVVLYLLVGKNVSATAYGISFAAYYMVAMATFGAFSGALTGNAQRIAQEKKDGWIRQLRLTPLPANGYVISKILVSMAITVPSIVIVLLLGRFYGGVHLAAPVEWLAIAATIWFGATDLRGAGRGHRLPVLAGPGAADRHARVLRLRDPRRPVVPAVRDPRGHRQVHAHLRRGEDRQRRDRQYRRAGGLALGLVVWLGIFVALATWSVRATAETV